MAHEDNDLEQMKDVRKTLANVYKTQAIDENVDNGNLTQLNNAILNVNKVIAWLEAHPPQEE